MSMSKQDFIALADAIKDHNRVTINTFGVNAGRMTFNQEQIESLADFCQSQNRNFMRSRWMGYIAGENGPSGGSIKK